MKGQWILSNLFCGEMTVQGIKPRALRSVLSRCFITELYAEIHQIVYFEMLMRVLFFSSLNMIFTLVLNCIISLAFLGLISIWSWHHSFCTLLDLIWVVFCWGFLHLYSQRIFFCSFLMMPLSRFAAGWYWPALWNELESVANFFTD